MKKILFFFTLVAWILTFTIHVFSITGTLSEYDYFWILHAGVFVSWIPTVLFLKKDEALKKFQQSGIVNRLNPLKFGAIIFRNSPTLLKVIAISGFLYANLNFWLFFDEFAEEENSGFRIFSGHWLAFYGIALAILYPFKRAVVL